MKRSFLALAATVCLVVTAGAQDLDTVSITDDFATGSRGNVSGSGTYGASETDPLSGSGIESLDYNGSDVTGGPITYTNEYAGASSGDSTNNESPVMNVGSLKHPDRDLTLSAITANSRPGATTPNEVIVISDDGGTNNLIFGDEGSADYYVEVDVYCPDETSNSAGVHNLSYVAIRAARDGATTDFSWTVDREDSYALAFNSQTLEVKAVQYQSGTSTGDAGSYTSASWAEEFGSTTVTGDAWHTFKIEANGSNIVFEVDGAVVANVVDSDVTDGRAILGWREVTPSGSDEIPAIFDNLRAGPSSPSTSVDSWTLY